VSAALVPGLVPELDAGLRAAGTPERAAGSKAYLKSDLDFYGAPVPAMRALVRALVVGVGGGEKGRGTAHPGLARGDVLRLATALWEPRVFERRLLAVLVLGAHGDRLEAADLDLLEAWVREGAMWALVDNIAGDVAGPLVDHVGEPVATATLDRWAADGDVWVRRSALLAHLRALRAGGGDWERFTRYADAMLDEREFWIRKAIGWVLRDTARRRPDLVFAWFLPRAGRASGVTTREVLKYLSPEQQEQVRSRTRSSG
jgi:3-methyladenine DNA glycosylase AlkD